MARVIVADQAKRDLRRILSDLSDLAGATERAAEGLIYSQHRCST
jgi:plasmid stabilization system protein ParE